MRLPELTEEQQRKIYNYLEDYWNLTLGPDGLDTKKSKEVERYLDLLSFEDM